MVGSFIDLDPKGADWCIKPPFSVPGSICSFGPQGGDVARVLGSFHVGGQLKQTPAGTDPKCQMDPRGGI